MIAKGFVLDDLALVRELELSPTEAAMEAPNGSERAS